MKKHIMFLISHNYLFFYPKEHSMKHKQIAGTSLPLTVLMILLMLCVMACPTEPESETISVTGISLDKTTLSLTVGGTATLAATVAPQDADNKAVAWTSSDTAIATGSYAGLVSALATGTATITAKTEDGGKTASCVVTVMTATVGDTAVTGVSLDKTTLPLTVGGTATLVATVAPQDADNKAVAWASSNTAIATVSNTGLVSALAAGTATITATTLEGGKTASCVVTVVTATVGGGAVTGVTLDKTTLSLTVGGTATLTATVAPQNADNKTVAWTTSDAQIAWVSETGQINAWAAGTATITATTEDGGKTASCVVTVTPVAVTGVSLDKTTLSLSAGDIAPLAATVAPQDADDKTVIWTSSDMAIATVSDTGLVSAIMAGTATITATTLDGGKTANCVVTVTPLVAVTGVSLDKTTLSLAIGLPTTLTATVTPQNADNIAVTWTSSDPAIATVSNTGLVSALVVGTATITATTVEGGKTASCVVTVTADGTGEETSPFLLTENTWADGEITATTPNSEVCYVLNVTSGTTYYVWLNDSRTSGGENSGDGSKTLRAQFSAYYAGESNLPFLNGASVAFTIPREFTATKTGPVKIKVNSSIKDDTGTYALVYSTANARPVLNITLTVSANGSTHYTTTRVTLTFNRAISGITKDDFVISGIPGVAIANWNGTTKAPVAYWLDINGFTEGGELTVTVQKTGYAISPPQPVTIYYAGSRWTRSASTPNSINAAAYRNGRFVSVGNASESAWSANGNTWNNVKISSAIFSYTAIAAGSNRFVAAGPNGRMAETIDGTSWAIISPSPFGSTQINGVIYGGGKFVAVGNSGQAAYFTDSLLLTSLNSVEDMKFGNSDIYDVAYGGGKFVAVGASGKAAYSTDGITWNAVTNTTFGSSAILAITYGNGKFVAAGQNGKAAYSTDGITWNAVTNTTFGSSAISDIAYGGGKFVAVSKNSNTAYSTDALTWTAIEDYFYASNGNTRFSFITYGGGRFVAGGNDTAYWVTP
jgi:uncharacterized protein YjdB